MISHPRAAEKRNQNSERRIALHVMNDVRIDRDDDTWDQRVCLVLNAECSPSRHRLNHDRNAR